MAKATIDRLVNGGYGLTKIDGRTVFVDRAIPGETVEVTIVGKLGGTELARVEEVLEPSPNRTVPPCVYYESCGGCDFQHIDYAAQVMLKQDMLRDSLQHIGGITPPEDFQFLPSPEAFAYRSRAEWHGDVVSGAFGYIERGAKTVVDVKECMVLTAKMQQSLTQVRAALLDPDRLKKPSEITGVANQDQVALYPNVSNIGESHVEITCAGERYLLDARCFFQSNTLLLETLMAEVMRDLNVAVKLDDRQSLAIDLYAGVGFFSLPLARKFDQVYGVENSDHAVGFARKNARNAGLTNIKFDTSPAERWVNQRLGSIGLVDCLIVDPPRSGLGTKMVKSIVAMQPQKLIYVSCDPATLARDLKGFVAEGYSFERLTGLDMFPQTTHIEAVAHLTVQD